MYKRLCSCFEPLEGDKKTSAIGSTYIIRETQRSVNAFQLYINTIFAQFTLQRIVKFRYIKCRFLSKTKNEMTLDCFILRSSSFFTNSDHPQSRVISVRSWYLASFFVPLFLQIRLGFVRRFSPFFVALL